MKRRKLSNLAKGDKFVFYGHLNVVTNKVGLAVTVFNFNKKETRHLNGHSKVIPYMGAVPNVIENKIVAL